MVRLLNQLRPREVSSPMQFILDDLRKEFGAPDSCETFRDISAWYKLQCEEE